MVTQEVTVPKDLDTAWDTVMRFFETERYKIKKQKPKKQIVAERGSKFASIGSGGLAGGGFDVDFRTITVDFKPVGETSTRLKVKAKFTWLTAGKAGRNKYLEEHIEFLFLEFNDVYVQKRQEELEKILAKQKEQKKER